MDKRLKAGAELLTGETFKPLKYEAPADGTEESGDPLEGLSLSDRFKLLNDTAVSVIADHVLPEEDLQAALEKRKAFPPQFNPDGVGGSL